jgi:hypothetical protein
MEQAPTPNSPPDDSGSPEQSVEALERELAQAQTELAEYQALLDELPSIYQTKFRHHVQGLAQDIRRLLDERRALQSQLGGALPPATPERPALLPPGRDPMAGEPAPVVPPRRPSSLRVRRWKRDITRGWQQWRDGAIQRGRSLGGTLPRRFHLPLVAAVAALAMASLVILADAWRRRSAAPLSGSGSAQQAAVPAASTPEPSRFQDQELRLRARGECWLEVQTLEGEVIYVNTLQAGDQQRIRLRDGLRIRAGRPDLLDVAVGDGPFEGLNMIDNLGWRTFLPDALPQAPPPPRAGAQEAPLP